MTVADFIQFLLTGRLLTWLIQTNGLLDPIRERYPIIKEMNECDLCMGFWVFLVMTVLVEKRISDKYPPWFACIVQAAISAFVVHLVRLGWHSKFGITVI